MIGWMLMGNLKNGGDTFVSNLNNATLATPTPPCLPTDKVAFVRNTIVLLTLLPPALYLPTTPIYQIFHVHDGKKTGHFHIGEPINLNFLGTGGIRKIIATRRTSRTKAP